MERIKWRHYGNDTLNTVIPYENTIYSGATGARPNLHLGVEDGILRLTDKDGPSVTGNNERLALHPTLTAFHQLWQDGQLWSSRRIVKQD